MPIFFRILNSNILCQSTTVINQAGNSYTLECHNSDSSYYVITWYHQPKEQNDLNYIGHLQYREASDDREHKKRFTLNGSATETSYLTINNVISTDSGTFFCAASKHSKTTAVPPCTINKFNQLINLAAIH
uniref:Ig-like domain-containing protein n=1 Tax=Erpetoichthys calabaricus TaxID=27687 RepID=A0A8C4RTE7_ERPCA